MTEQYHTTVLKKELADKQMANPRYSLRAFARDLEINCSTLSQVLRGKRSLPLKRAEHVADKLRLREIEKKVFLESFNHPRLKIDQINVPGIDTRKEISSDGTHFFDSLEYSAFFELFQLENFEVTPLSATHKLGISLERAMQIRDLLLKEDMISLDSEGKMSLKHNSVKTKLNDTSPSVKNSHLEGLDLAKRELLKDHNKSSFSSVTLAVAKEDLEEARLVIREFRKKIVQLFQAKDKKDIYHLAIQFFPLSDIENQEKSCN